MEIVKNGQKGRILIPASIRRKFEANIISLEVFKDELELKPVKILLLSELFDSEVD